LREVSRLARKVIGAKEGAFATSAAPAVSMLHAR
jgi:hypothetical protein